MAETKGYPLSLRTTLPAPRQRIFELLTDPDEVQRWFGPAGYTVAQIDMDARVGGSYRLTMQPPEGDAFHIAGVLTEITPVEGLAYTFAYEEPGPEDVETLVTISLDDAPGGGTELSLEQGLFATEARVVLHRGGWSDSFEKLAALISGPR